MPYNISHKISIIFTYQYNYNNNILNEIPQAKCEEGRVYEPYHYLGEIDISVQLLYVFYSIFNNRKKEQNH